MSLDPQLAAQAKQLISIAFSAATANAFGEIQVGTATTVLVRFEGRVGETESPAGTMDLSRFPRPLIILDGASGITPDFGMHLWLPGVSSSTPSLAKKLKFIAPYFDEIGQLDHWELGIAGLQ